MQLSVCSRQFRRGKYFPHRDIDICHAVFKIRLFFRIFQFVKLYTQICPVFTFSQNMHTRSEIQCIDQLLLNLLIQIIVQRIDFYSLTKDFFKLISDRRYRIGDDRETSLLAFDIAVRNLTNLILHMHF